MAKNTDLMGLGIAPAPARRLARTPVSIVAVGGTLASAQAIGTDPCIAYVVSGTSAVSLPAVGGDGCALGDEFIIANLTAASIVIFANTSSQVIYASGGSLSGGVGMTLGAGLAATFYPITASVWSGSRGA